MTTAHAVADPELDRVASDVLAVRARGDRVERARGPGGSGEPSRASTLGGPAPRQRDHRRCRAFDTVRAAVAIWRSASGRSTGGCRDSASSAAASSHWRRRSLSP